MGSGMNANTIQRKMRLRLEVRTLQVCVCSVTAMLALSVGFRIKYPLFSPI
jgi:hypothetical protein